MKLITMSHELQPDLRRDGHPFVIVDDEVYDDTAFRHFRTIEEAAAAFVGAQEAADAGRAQ